MWTHTFNLACGTFKKNGTRRTNSTTRTSRPKRQTRRTRKHSSRQRTSRRRRDGPTTHHTPPTGPSNTLMASKRHKSRDGFRRRPECHTPIKPGMGGTTPKNRKRKLFMDHCTTGSNKMRPGHSQHTSISETLRKTRTHSSNTQLHTSKIPQIRTLR